MTDLNSNNSVYNNVNSKILVKEISKIDSENDEAVLTECIRIFNSLTKNDDDKKELIYYLHWSCLESLGLCRPMAIFMHALLGKNSCATPKEWFHLLQEDFEVPFCYYFEVFFKILVPGSRSAL